MRYLATKVSDQREAPQGSGMRGRLAKFVLFHVIIVPHMVACLLIPGVSASAQDAIDSLRDGFKRMEIGRLTLITDLPIDDELRAWPEVLDQAVANWTQQWRLDPAKTQSWRLTAFLIGDRKRFAESGLAPQAPSFEDGYQQQDTIFLVEQPSVYYRRHLFLHEATHWAMYRSFGGAGAPWYMEGMADLYGTHRWSDRVLSLGILPRNATEVPHWGRFKRIKDMLGRDDIPSLRQIISYSNESGNRMDRYVWSWAACIFFSNHPNYNSAFTSAAEPPLDYSMRVSEKLLSSLEDRWPWVVAEWNGFLTDFDFGYDPARSLPRLEDAAWKVLDSQESSRESDRELIVCEVASERGWQATGVRVRAGETLRISAEGSCRMGTGSNGNAWISEPQGVSIRYIQHQPLGRLMATIVPLSGNERTELWRSTPIGRSANLRSETEGLLMLKINDAAGDLGDNQGSLHAVIELEKP